MEWVYTHFAILFLDLCVEDRIYINQNVSNGVGITNSELIQILHQN